jgi:shikimate 5-dehydrogenase
MVVLDLTALPRSTPLIREARMRGCAVVDPRRVLVEQARVHVRRIAGETPAAEPLLEKLGGWLQED